MKEAAHLYKRGKNITFSNFEGTLKELPEDLFLKNEGTRMRREFFMKEVVGP